VRIAFYAPLKPPDPPGPSGDRRSPNCSCARCASSHQPFGRLTIAQLCGDGNPARQARIAAIARDWLAAASALAAAADLAPWVWFTYHIYYKAPNWLGPRVSAALGIPYIVR